MLPVFQRIVFQKKQLWLLYDDLGTRCIHERKEINTFWNNQLVANVDNDYNLKYTGFSKFI